MKEDAPNKVSEAGKGWFGQLPVRWDQRFWNSDKIISLSAFVISIATLLALMYQIRLSGEQNELVRKQQYASVLPYLAIQVGTNNGSELFRLTLKNNGVGPAFIDEIRVVYNSQTYVGDP